MADQQPEVIQQQIHQTSSSLKDKVEQLEERVLDTVKGTTDAVSETVENVKDSVAETIESVKETVQETVASVKRTFDLKYQTDRHPWAMMSGSVVVGFAVGKLLSSRRRRSKQKHPSGSGHPSTPGTSAGHPNTGPMVSPTSFRPEAVDNHQPSFWSRLWGRFDKEINTVKEMAIGTLVGTLRDVAKQALPASLSAKVDEVMNSVTTKLGGEPIRGPVAQSSPVEACSSR
jgi:ElaB/YqjD/DUF883 family membrane-anchored ribosome-binding protein